MDKEKLKKIVDTIIRIVEIIIGVICGTELTTFLPF